MKRGNTIYGESLCSDEINGDRGHASSVLSGYFGRVFHLGGIGGAPYVGKTGFSAFSHHVPDDGHVFVIFGPHIGYSALGEAAKFQRQGQAAISTACGAVVAAYNQCRSGARVQLDPHDTQQTWLRWKLRPECESVARATDPMVQLVMRAYKAIEEEILAIVNTDFGSGNLFLLGGIQINMPDMDGWFMPLHFSVRWAGGEPINLMPALHY